MESNKVEYVVLLMSDHNIVVNQIERKQQGRKAEDIWRRYRKCWIAIWEVEGIVEVQGGVKV